MSFCKSWVIITSCCIRVEVHLSSAESANCNNWNKSRSVFSHIQIKLKDCRKKVISVNKKIEIIFVIINMLFRALQGKVVWYIFYFYYSYMLLCSVTFLPTFISYILSYLFIYLFILLFIYIFRLNLYIFYIHISWNIGLYTEQILIVCRIKWNSCYLN